jgi:hypothetical protein
MYIGRVIANFGWNVVIKDMVSLYESSPTIANQKAAIGVGSIFQLIGGAVESAGSKAQAGMPWV